MPVAVDAFRYGAVPKVTAYLLTLVSSLLTYFAPAHVLMKQTRPFGSLYQSVQIMVPRTHLLLDHYRQPDCAHAWRGEEMGCESSFIGDRAVTDHQHGLPDDVPFVMPNTGGVTVTPLTANHCESKSPVPYV